MIRHVVLLELSHETTHEQLEALRSALTELPDTIDGVEALTCGPDLGLDESNVTFGLVVDCGDVAAWHAYQQHPSHQRVIAEHIAPLLVSKTALQMDVQ